jgi:hypothetical protein
LKDLTLDSDEGKALFLIFDEDGLRSESELQHRFGWTKGKTRKVVSWLAQQKLIRPKNMVRIVDGERVGLPLKRGQNRSLACTEKGKREGAKLRSEFELKSVERVTSVLKPYLVVEIVSRSQKDKMTNSNQTLDEFLATNHKIANKLRIAIWQAEDITRW